MSTWRQEWKEGEWKVKRDRDGVKGRGMLCVSDGLMFYEFMNPSHLLIVFFFQFWKENQWRNIFITCLLFMVIVVLFLLYRTLFYHYFIVIECYLCATLLFKNLLLLCKLLLSENTVKISITDVKDSASCYSWKMKHISVFSFAN